MFGVSMTMHEALRAFADLSPLEQLAKFKSLVTQWINFFQRSHHNSVQHLPLIHGNKEPWRDPLPITKDMTNKSRLDGRAEHFEGYVKQPRPLTAQCPLDELPKKLPPDDVYEPNTDVPPPSELPEIKRKTMCGQTLSSFPQYRRIQVLESSVDLCAAYKVHDTSHANPDSWHVQVRAMMHVCGPSCWKCNKNGTRVCRHHCYHLTVLEPDLCC